VEGRSDPFDCCVRVGGFHLISHMVVEKMNENQTPLAQIQPNRAHTTSQWDNRYFFGSISVTVFWGARKPAINPCRTLVHSYARVGYHQNKISNVTNCSS
jgi:hypothetical protein